MYVKVYKPKSIINSPCGAREQLNLFHMKKHFSKWLPCFVLAFQIISFTSCDKDEEPNFVPQTTIPNPNGTIIAFLNEDRQDLGNSCEIHWTFPNNITYHDDELIVNLGEMEGLGNIELHHILDIPEEEWSPNVACMAGCGYVVHHQLSNSYTGYSAFYVEKILTDPSGKAIGAEILFCPFTLKGWNK